MFWFIVIIILCCLLSSSGAATYYFMFMNNKTICPDNSFITSMSSIAIPEEKRFVGVTNVKCSNNTSLPDAIITPLPESTKTYHVANKPAGFIASTIFPPAMLNCAGEEKLIGYTKIDNSLKFVCK